MSEERRSSSSLPLEEVEAVVEKEEEEEEVDVGEEEKVESGVESKTGSASALRRFRGLRRRSSAERSVVDIDTARLRMRFSNDQRRGRSAKESDWLAFFFRKSFFLSQKTF